MLHYHRTQQAIRKNAAKPIDPPGWAGDTDVFHVTKCIDSHFVTVQGETFALNIGFEVVHSDRGTIPTKVNRPAISRLGEDMDFPYSVTVAHAAADLFLTKASHQKGLNPNCRVRILDMNIASWRLAFDDLINTDAPPLRVHSSDPEAPPELFPRDSASARQLLEEAIGEYRNSEFLLTEHKQAPQETNTMKTPKRTIFSKLFR